MKTNRDAQLRKVLDRFDAALCADPLSVSSRQSSLELPFIDSDDLKLVFDSVRETVRRDTPLCEISPPCIIFGDIHGHFIELIRFVQKFGLPVEHKFVFLGDLIDRGEFSLETITYLFLLKYFYSENVFLIRGNHEFQPVFTHSGFYSDILSHPIDHVAFTSLLNTLNLLPLACVIGGKYFCVHGGIGPSVSLEDIKKIDLPVDNFESDIISEIVWSDPDPDVKGYVHSPRGKGNLFGEDVLSLFLEKNNLKAIIRAHETVEKGVKEMFDGKLVTVFSASNYCGTQNNSGGSITIHNDMSYSTTIFEPLAYYQRCFTIFKRKVMKPSKSSIITTFPVEQTVDFAKYPVSARSSGKKIAAVPSFPKGKEMNPMQWLQAPPTIPGLVLKHASVPKKDGKEVTSFQSPRHQIGKRKSFLF